MDDFNERYNNTTHSIELRKAFEEYQKTNDISTLWLKLEILVSMEHYGYLMDLLRDYTDGKTLSQFWNDLINAEMTKRELIKE